MLLCMNALKEYTQPTKLYKCQHTWTKISMVLKCVSSVTVNYEMIGAIWTGATEDTSEEEKYLSIAVINSK